MKLSYVLLITVCIAGSIQPASLSTTGVHRRPLASQTYWAQVAPSQEDLKRLRALSTADMTALIQESSELCMLYRPEDVAREAFDRLASGALTPDELGSAYDMWVDFIIPHERDLTMLHSYQELYRDVQFRYGYEGGIDDIFAMIQRGVTAYDTES